VPNHNATAPLLPIVTAALEQRDLRCVALSESSIGLPIRTDVAAYDCLVVVDDAQRTVSCYAALAAQVPEVRRLAVAEAIARANYGLRVGCFELDMGDGEVRFRVSVDVEGGELTTEMFKYMLAAAVTTSDRYYTALMRVIFAGATPAEAIAEAEAA
jgi:hypothetical protein